MHTNNSILMPLTNRLKDESSREFRFLENKFPIVKLLTEKTHPLAALKSFHFMNLSRETVLPSEVPSSQRRVVGTAIDYRIRYYFDITPSTELAAYRGARVANKLYYHPMTGECISPIFPTDFTANFFKNLENTLKRIKPVNRLLDQISEELLARYCVILAYFEALFRAGRSINSPLHTLSQKATLQDLLNLPEPSFIKDVMDLSKSFYEDAKSLFDKPCKLNPTFDGTNDIGGADADFILEDTLYEIKTVSDLNPSCFREAIYQLLGYVLLDYSDSHHIRKIGIYFTRQRQFWSIPLYLFLIPHASLSQSSSWKPESEKEIKKQLSFLRREFKQLL